MKTLFVLCVWIAASCGKDMKTEPTTRMTPEEAAKLAAAIAPLEQAALERAAERKRGVAAALAADLPELGGACPVMIDMPDPRAPRSGGLDMERMKREVNTLVRIDLTFHKGSSAANSSKLVQHFQRQLDTARKMTFAEAQAILAELRDEAFWDYDVTIVEDQHVDAKSGDGGFTGGRIRGRALLWSYPQKKVLCMSVIDAASSDKVTVTTRRVGDRTTDNASTALGADLLMNALQQGVRSMRVVE